MAQDLKSYLERLAETYPGELVEEQEVIDPPQHEVSAYLKLLEDKGQLPAVLFRHVKNVKGERSQFPLVHNLFATRPRCAMAIGLDSSNYRMDLVARFGEIQENPVAYEVVQPDQAPVMENVWREGVDITLLPAARYHEKDAGPYFVMACGMRAKSDNFYNVTMMKNMVKGPQRMSLSAASHHHIARMIAEYEAAGEPAPVVVVLGHHPAFYLGSCALTPYGNDDYRTLGGYLGEPLRVVPSATLGEDFLVPADAEIVVEGLVLPGVREIQNPFGEISGHYQQPHMFPVIEPQAICFRNDAIMEGILPAHPEHFNLGGIPKEGSVFNAIKRVVPDVRAICLPHTGCSRFSCYISVDKRTYRDVQVAAMTAFSEMPNLKVAVVLDDEIDVFNEAEVMWAVTTQVRWDKDLVVVPKVQSVRSWLGDAVVIIDATRPEEVSDFPERNKIPEATIDRMRGMFETHQ